MEDNAFILLLKELGFLPIRGSSTCWMYTGGENWDVVAEVYDNGSADAFYSWAYGDDDISWKGSQADLVGFRNWFDSL